MTELANSTIERARNDIVDLRRGLNDLERWLESRRYLPQSEEMCQRLSQLGEFLERLSSGLDQQERERARLVGLFAVSRAVNSTLDLAQVLDSAMDIAIQTTGAERGFLMLKDEVTGSLAFQVARNMDRDTIARPTFEVSRSIIQQVAESGLPVLTTDALRDPRFSETDSVVSLSLRSILCIPLLVKERLIGVVYVDNRLHIGQFAAADLEALRAFADQAAIAIDNARLFSSVQQQMLQIAGLKTFQDNIFASIASGVIAIDPDGRVAAVNRAAEAIFDISEREVLGVFYRDMLAPYMGTPLPQLVEMAKQSGARQFATEIETDVPGRGTMHLLFSVSSLKDALGNPEGVTIVADDLTEKRKLEATREIFRRYLAPAVVDRLPANPEELRLGGQRQEITILFADIRGFTSLSELLEPEELVEILNRYLSVASDAILEYEGTLDKFVGDAIMAIFNAPLPQADHALLAARAALKMRDAVHELHEHMAPEMRLDFGIGIHTGDAVVGNVGTHQQMNFTAIGDAVNLAKRLQENARGGEILMSERAHALIRDQVSSKRRRLLKVKGRTHVEEVWELAGPAGELVKKRTRRGD